MTTQTLAGRDLDRAVAEHVMGVTVRKDGPFWWRYSEAYDLSINIIDGGTSGPYHAEADAWADIPWFSSDLGQAWMVLHEGLIRFGNAAIRFDMEEWGREPGDIAWVTIGGVTLFGEVPVTICRAALAAAGHHTI